MFEDLNERRKKAIEASVERRKTIDEKLAKLMKEEAELRRKEEQYQWAQELLQTIKIFPGPLERYCQLYGPAQEIVIDGPNTGVGIEVVHELGVGGVCRDNPGTVLNIISELSVSELKEQGLIALVDASIAHSIVRKRSHTCFYGTPVRRKYSEGT